MVKTVAVLGAGNGGCATAADLSLRGFKVNLWNRSYNRIAPILKSGGIELTGRIREQGFAKLNRITWSNNIKETVQDAEIIIVTVPTFGHKDIAARCAPYLSEGQTIVLNPGYFGSLEFTKTLRSMGVKKEIRIAETSTLTYACRMLGPAKVKVIVATKFFLFGTFPGEEVKETVSIFKQLYPSAIKAINVLEVFLNNPNPLVHPVGILLNTWPIENLKRLCFYKDCVTLSVAKVIQAIDEERLALCKTLGFRQISTKKRLIMGKYAEEGTIQEMYNNSILRSIEAPSSIKSRYITEDVPYGLVSWASLGRMLDVPMPTVESLIKLASVINEVDYYKKGRTAEKLEISGLDAEGLNKFLAEGVR
ncbi:NAD/NADP octopine/nopaline dehydrogenase family protein [Candidatus Bathyarchaeota archaeon]|nr:NAD/NADP octopine/nopaline dehydrogenase family protein [Candidatus Bathyarchaeota archaeon]